MEGEEKKKEEFLKRIFDPMSNANEGPFHLRWMDPDYFYVYNLNYGKAVLKYLENYSLRSKNERHIDYPVDTIAFKKGTFRHVGICSKLRNNCLVDMIRYDEVRCERLNSKMKSVVTISIPIPTKAVSSVTLEFDEQGKAYVSFAEDSELRVYVYDLVGQLLHSYNLGEVNKRFEQAEMNSESVNSTSSYSKWDTHGFLVGKEFCVIVEHTKANGYEGALHVVKCIRIPSNTEPPRF